MRELNYYPNAIARSLARRATSTVGLMIARPAEVAFANPFFPEVIRGLGTILQERGYNLLLESAPTPADERAACLRMLRQRRVDGVILTASRLRDSLLHDLSAEGLPHVLIGRPTQSVGSTWVDNDNVAVGTMAVQHLVQRGHRRIGLINGPGDLVVCADRRQGYLNALAGAAVRPVSVLERVGNFTREGGYRAMCELLQLPHPPTAVFCTDDGMAIGALEYLKEQDRVRTVAIVGVNDDPLAAFVDPALSTVRIPVFELGATAAQKLLDVLAGRPGTGPAILPALLVVRASSDWSV